jgi:hypothetical protein
MLEDAGVESHEHTTSTAGFIPGGWRPTLDKDGNVVGTGSGSASEFVYLEPNAPPTQPMSEYETWYNLASSSNSVCETKTNCKALTEGAVVSGSSSEPMFEYQAQYNLASSSSNVCETSFDATTKRDAASGNQHPNSVEQQKDCGSSGLPSPRSPAPTTAPTTAARCTTTGGPTRAPSLAPENLESAYEFGDTAIGALLELSTATTEGRGVGVAAPAPRPPTRAPRLTPEPLETEYQYEDTAVGALLGLGTASTTRRGEEDNRSADGVLPAPIISVDAGEHARVSLHDNDVLNNVAFSSSRFDETSFGEVDDGCVLTVVVKTPATKPTSRKGKKKKWKDYVRSTNGAANLQLLDADDKTFCI